MTRGNQQADLRRRTVMRPRRPRHIVPLLLLAALGLGACGTSAPVTSGAGRSTTTVPSSDGGASEPGSDGCEPGAGAGPTRSTIQELPDPGGIGYGCEGEVPPGGPGTPDPDTPVSTVVGPGDGTDPSQDPVPGQVKNRDDLQDPRVELPESLEIDPDDDRLVHVRFWGGVPECYGAHAEAVDRGDRVEVTLTTGWITRGDVACPELAQYQQVDVRLDEPLAGRPLVATRPPA